MIRSGRSMARLLLVAMWAGLGVASASTAYAAGPLGLLIAGPLLVVDMTAHEREEYRQRMGHVWLGFSEDHIRRFMDQAGFSSVRIDALTPAAEAKGPALFAAIARKS